MVTTTVVGLSEVLSRHLQHRAHISSKASATVARRAADPNRCGGPVLVLQVLLRGLASGPRGVQLGTPQWR